MPIDTSMYSMAKGLDIGSALGEGMQLREQMDARKARKKAEGEQEQVKAAYARGTYVDEKGNNAIDQDQTISALTQVNPQLAMQEKERFQQQQIQKEKADREKQMYHSELISSALGGVKDQQTWDIAKADLSRKGVDISQYKDVPYDKSHVEYISNSLRPVKERFEQDMRLREVQAKERALGIKNKNALAKAGKMSVTQAKQLGLYNSGAEAEKQYQAAISKGGINSFDGSSSFQWIDKNDWAPSFLKSSESKEAHAAQDRWVEAFLRDASGAAIPPSERGAYAKDFFPVAGDSKQAVEDKAKARQVKMENAKLAAGAVPDAQLHELPDDEIDRLYTQAGGQ